MTAMFPELRTLATLGARDQVLAGIVLLALAALLGLAVRATWKTLRKYPPDALLTFADATLTSVVVATGMWRFAGRYLHFSGLERVLLFAILEIAVMACAVRARRHILETGAAGQEGVAIWLISLGSGVFAALAATSVPERLFRLLIPLLATWLWERSLLPARREAGKKSWWQVHAERLLAKVGLGTLELRTDDESAAEWRILQLAQAVVRAKRAGAHARAQAWHVRRRWLRWRVDVLTAAANEHAELATCPGRQDLLVAYIGAQLGTGTLIAMEPPAPWDTATVRAAWERAQQTVPEDAQETPESRPEDGLEDGPETVSEDSLGDGPEDGPERGSGDGSRDARKPSRRAAVRLRPGHGKTAEQLVPNVLAMYEAYGPLGRDRIKADLHVGSDTAKEALSLAMAELKRQQDGQSETSEAGATVLPIDRAARG